MSDIIFEKALLSLRDVGILVFDSNNEKGEEEGFSDVVKLNLDFKGQ